MARFRKGTTDHDGDGRMGGSMKENDMPTKSKAAKAAPKPKKTAAKEPAAHKARDASMQKLFERGRHANKSGIRREDSPYTGAERDAWQDGWDYQGA